MHDREHVISVVLTNEDWKAFLRIQPEPVSWLRERIRERIAAEHRAVPATSTGAPVQAQTHASTAA
jgi:hypothetical protein